MTPVLRTRGMMLLRTNAVPLAHPLRQTRHLYKKTDEEEEYEIDLVTLKKVPKRKKRSIKSVMNVASPSISYGSNSSQMNEKTVGVRQNIPIVEIPMAKPVPLEDKSEEHIVNLNKPSITCKEIKDHTHIMSELVGLPPSERADRIEDLLKLVSKEVPSLSHQAEKLSTDIEANIKKMKEIKAKISEVERKEKDALREFLNKEDNNDDVMLRIKREDLESFLKDAKLTKDRDDEEHFREQRRFERALNFNSSRTLEKRNFFSPVDEKLARSVKRGRAPKLNDNKDELLFPSLPRASGTFIHEFMTYVNGKQIITLENPFGRHYRVPDLVAVFEGIDNSQKYLKTTKQFEDQKWRLIGTKPMGDETILVFERYIDKEQHAKDQRKKKIKKWAVIVLVGFSAINTVGFILESEQNTQYPVDENGNPTKTR